MQEDKIREEEKYDGLYAVCTDLLDDEVSDILKVSEGRWQIESCFRIMKTDFSARPVYVRREDRIKAHFLICFLSLLIYRLLEKKLGSKYTCEQILDTLKNFDFANLEDQGFMPLYRRTELTDALHEACDFRTDFKFITKRKMKGIQKKSKGKEQITILRVYYKNAVRPVFAVLTAFLFLLNCQRWEYLEVNFDLQVKAEPALYTQGFSDGIQLLKYFGVL